MKTDNIIKIFSEAFKTLTYREREIFKMRSGIGDGYVYTLEQIGRIYKVSSSRVRNVESKVILKINSFIKKDETK